MKLYFERVVSDYLIQECLTFYKTRSEYDTELMKMCNPGHFVPVFTALAEHLMGKKLTYLAGNFYCHSMPYLPHTDYRVSYAKSLNLVIPLELNADSAGLVVFDQQYKKDSVTWCLDRPLIEFKLNTGIQGRPFDTPGVSNLTYVDICDSFYSKHLSHYSKFNYFGLSGSYFDFLPGNIMIFDNTYIHCTSNFLGEKTGLTLRFSYE